MPRTSNVRITGDDIQNLRLARSYGIDQFCELIGLNRSRLEVLERGHKRATPYEVDAFYRFVKGRLEDSLLPLRVVRWRKEHHLTQKQAIRVLGIARSTICRMESGYGHISYSVIQKFVKWEKATHMEIETEVNKHPDIKISPPVWADTPSEMIDEGLVFYRYRHKGGSTYLRDVQKILELDNSSMGRVLGVSGGMINRMKQMRSKMPYQVRTCLVSIGKWMQLNNAIPDAEKLAEIVKHPNGVPNTSAVVEAVREAQGSPEKATASPPAPAPEVPEVKDNIDAPYPSGLSQKEDLQDAIKLLNMKLTKADMDMVQKDTKLEHCVDKTEALLAMVISAAFGVGITLLIQHLTGS